MAKNKFLSCDFDDYDDGSENSGKSRDRDMEPGDAGWLGDDEDSKWVKDL